ncbi:tagatose-bisphosphate aldolase, partial [candidate division WOR_3 bacterium SM23_60]
MLVDLNEVLPKARRDRYAVGHFNTSNLEITQAIIDAAESLKAPVIVATSERAIAYAGIENISQIV